MSNDDPHKDDKSSLRKFLLLTFLLGLWLLGAISGMLIFNLFNFINFRSKGHILILLLLISGSIVLLVISYLFFPRGKDGKKEKRGNGYTNRNVLSA
jgi:ABC-type branched-subunit amino acid transport system permease subunit